MTTTLDIQIPIQFYNSTPVEKQRMNSKEINHNSGGTTRSGTPDGKDDFVQDDHNEFNHDTPVKSKSFTSEGGFEIG